MSEKINYARRGTIVFGLTVASLFFVVGGGWAALAPISSAIIANGEVGPVSERQVIQHLEGGIVEQINVSNGDAVSPGDELVVLRAVSAQSDLTALQARQRALLVEAARLTAERDDLAQISFTHEALRDDADRSVPALKQAELKRFEARRKALANEIMIRERQIEQTGVEIQGLRNQIAQTLEQMGLISQEVAGVAELYEKKLVPVSRYLALKRARSELGSELSRLEAAIAASESRISEYELQILGLQRRREAEVEDRLAEVEASLAEVEATLTKSQDTLERTILRAPSSGVVINLSVTGPGAVVRQGDTILELVPDDDDLVINIELQPNDIDSVQVGQAATVMFTGLPARDMQRLDGQVIWVAADSMEDQRTGLQSYQARVALAEGAVAGLPENIDLTSGMPAQVFIHEGSQTLLQYTMKPLMGSFERAFRER
ncbi:HlyD family type I secretion periplasmic adaptor subunit [Algihabitans albus]|uniref:HlyD family type I secretion periplasmic adaptor subunit n=1 Tax=Algihabitans albus TaxID=2164067 RepID=UPI000E5CC180|nr:HlyD family type I secretion periplasmic adaptor subunit [Algihabitans albus]